MEYPRSKFVDCVVESITDAIFIGICCNGIYFLV